MIYLEPTALGWDPILKSWLNTLPESYGKDFSKLVDALFQWIVPPCLTFVRKLCKVRHRNVVVYNLVILVRYMQYVILFSKLKYLKPLAHNVVHKQRNTLNDTSSCRFLIHMYHLNIVMGTTLRACVFVQVLRFSMVLLRA